MSEWISADNPPLPLGDSYLVMLRDDNEHGLTSKRPIMAEYGFFRDRDIWTTYIWDENVDINSDVIHWMPLPEPPK